MLVMIGPSALMANLVAVHLEAQQEDVLRAAVVA